MSSVVAPSFAQKLGVEVALLRGLGLVERLAGVFEIGAGILAVGIEEQIVKALIEVIVRGDVAPGAAPVVALVQAAKCQARLGQRLRPGLTLEFREVARAKLQEVVKAAFGYDQPSVHVEFAKRQRGIEHEPPFRRCVQKFHAKRRPRAVAEGLGHSVCGHHFQATPTNQFPQKSPKRRAHPSRPNRLARS